MKTTPLATVCAVLALLLAFQPLRGLAQDPGSSATAAPAPAAESGVPPGPGAPGGEQPFRQRMNEFLKKSLKVSDEEWSVIQPLLEKVQTKQRDLMRGRSGFMGNRRGAAANENRSAPPERAGSAEAQALRAALENEGSSPADIKAKLEAVRASRKKAADELEQAREELRRVLTQRQEATLVLVGILE